MTTGSDNIYAAPEINLVDFAFDQRVVDVFPDMIRRSVPAYETIVPLAALVAARSIPEQAQIAGGSIYDLGCSRGATTAALLTYAPPNVRVIGVDNSAQMIAAARDGIEALTSKEAASRVAFRCENIQDTPIDNAAAVVATYTLQFVPPTQRTAQLQRILHGLLPGAPFVYAEKVVLDDSQGQQWSEAIHHEFKRSNGYSDLEVAQKRQAIEKVMIPESISTHLLRLEQVGFERPHLWFQCLNWAAFIGYAPDAGAPAADY